MFAELDRATIADVRVLIEELDGKGHQEIVAILDERTERKVYQREKSHAAGTLRVIFAWGKACLWFIGAFVKHNDREGERRMRRILPRARQVENWGVND